LLGSVLVLLSIPLASINRRSLFFQIAPLKGARKAELSGKITDFERACSKAFGNS
jgi:hypothetical protein